MNRNRYLVVAGVLWCSASSVHAQQVEVSQNCCGPYTLQLCLESLSCSDAARQVADILPCTDQQVSLADIKRCATRLGLYAIAIQWTEKIPELRLGEAPAVLPIVLGNGRRHFVAALRVSPHRELLIVDFPGSPQWVPEEALRTAYRWDGTFLYIVKNQGVMNSLEHRTRTPWLTFAPAMAGAVLLLLASFARSPQRRARAAVRHGFTLVELMVSLSVISLLLALLLPAVQSAREASRSTQCRSHLRQIGLALHQYAEVFGYVPPQMAPFGAVQPRRPPSLANTTNFSALCRLLPYLDQSAIYDDLMSLDVSTVASRPPDPVVVFTCPSDRVPPGGCSFRISTGTSPGYHLSVEEVPPHSADAGAGFITGRRLSQIVDGLSQTSFFCERVVGDGDDRDFSAWQDMAMAPSIPDDAHLPDRTAMACRSVTTQPSEHRSDLGDSWIPADAWYTTYNHILTPNSRVPDCWVHTHRVVTARSLHPGGVNLLTGDGAVHFVSTSIDLVTWRALGTINRGEAIGDF